MSDRPIIPGDLVVIVRGPRCGGTNAIGFIFEVAGILRDLAVRCTLCGGKHRVATLALVHGKYVVEVSRLKRIDPPAETERRKEREEIEA